MDVKEEKNFCDTENLLESGKIPKLLECQLCEEEVSSDAVAACLRCEKKWCGDCAMSWRAKCLEMDIQDSCPYCRNNDIAYPFVIEEIDDDAEARESCNEAIKGIFVLITYSFLLMCVIMYLYDISSIDTTDDFMYFIMYILFLAYVMACLGLASRSLLKCCRRGQ